MENPLNRVYILKKYNAIGMLLDIPEVVEAGQIFTNGQKALDDPENAVAVIEVVETVKLVDRYGPEKVAHIMLPRLPEVRHWKTLCWFLDAQYAREYRISNGYPQIRLPLSDYFTAYKNAVEAISLQLENTLPRDLLAIVDADLMRNVPGFREHYTVEDMSKDYHAVNEAVRPEVARRNPNRPTMREVLDCLETRYADDEMVELEDWGTIL